MNWMIMRAYFYTFDTSNGTGHNLVEDMVGALQGLLRDDTSLLQQICKGYARRELVVEPVENNKKRGGLQNLQVSISAPASLPDGPK